MMPVFLGLMLLGAVLVLGASLFLGKSTKLITSDGNAYYAWLPTLFIDHDLDFRNNFRDLYAPDSIRNSVIMTPDGRGANKCPVGMAILELPGFALGHVAARLASVPADGVSAPYQIAVAAWLVVLYLFSFYLFYLALLRYSVSAPLAFLFSAMALVGTNVIHYIAKEPAMPHVANVALINLVLFVSSSGRRGLGRDILAGVLLGMLLITRNATLAVVPWLVFLLLRNGFSIRRSLALATGPVLLFALNLLCFYLLWRHLVIRTYGNEGFTGGLAGMAGTLFGSRHGLFVYHPWYLVLLALNVIGLWRLREHRSSLMLILLAFTLLWVFNGTWWCWWFSAGFGNRAFIEIAIPLTFGAALVAQREVPAISRAGQRALAAGLVLVVLLNVNLWTGYLLGRYAADGKDTVAKTYLWWR